MIQKIDIYIQKNRHMKKLFILSLLISSYCFAQKDIPFSMIQNSAIYPGCEKRKDKKKCFSEMTNKHVKENFDISLIKNQKFKRTINMAAVFKIDTSGDIKDIRVKGNDSVLKEDIMQVLKEFPKMKPAMHKGEKVNMLYFLPLVFRVE